MLQCPWVLSCRTGEKPRHATACTRDEIETKKTTQTYSSVLVEEKNSRPKFFSTTLASFSSSLAQGAQQQSPCASLLSSPSLFSHHHLPTVFEELALLERDPLPLFEGPRPLKRERGAGRRGNPFFCSSLFDACLDDVRCGPPRRGSLGRLVRSGRRALEAARCSFFLRDVGGGQSHRQVIIQGREMHSSFSFEVFSWTADKACCSMPFPLFRAPFQPALWPNRPTETGDFPVPCACDAKSWSISSALLFLCPSFLRKRRVLRFDVAPRNASATLSYISLSFSQKTRITIHSPRLDEAGVAALHVAVRERG